jgi:uncharacterized repeat protein (TIGR01451 family)
VHGVITGGLASALAIVGLVAFATPAFAQDNVITANASCASPLGNGAQIMWTIANNSNLPETGSVTTVTGGFSTLNTTTFSIPASPGQPSQTATLTQTLAAGATGVVTLDVSSTLSDGVSQTDSGTFDLSTINCAAPEQTIAGHIYLCNNGNPTTTEETGGTLAASGTGHTTVPSALNPLAPANVISGTYSMTASNPPGFQLVACGGSSSPNGAGTSATESVSVPSGGAGVGVFYVSPSSPPVPVTPSATVNSNPPTTTSDSSNQPSTPINSLPPSTGTNWNKASIALKKSASITSFWAPGTPITYSYTVTNTGNVTLDPVTVTDPMAGLSPISCPATSLAPWVSETCTATYTTTQSDVDHGSLENTGTATGTPPSGPTVTAQSSVCIPAVQTPSISVLKSANVTTVSAVGQVVTYSFTIANTGNVTLYDVDVTDAQASPSLGSSLGPITCTTGTNGSITLAPATTDACSADYTVTQADLTNNSIEDTATVTGQPPNQLPPVTDTSTLTLTVTSVSVVKAASPSGGVVAGSATPIVYTLTVTNTGSATTTAPIVVTDSAPTGTTLVASSPACATGGPPTCTVAVNSGMITWTIPAGVTPGASYTLTYLVTANASDATGIITNTASWSGPSCGAPVAAPPVTTTCPTNTVKTPVTAAPVTTSVVTTAAPPATTPPAASTPPRPTTPLAFTGAPLTREWMIGAGELLLGAALVIVARRRRCSPRHTAR